LIRAYLAASDKTRLSDLTPQKQARGGAMPEGSGGPAPTPPGIGLPPPKKQLTA